jgi:hypothetical protein
MKLANVGDEVVENVNIQCVLPGYVTAWSGEAEKTLRSIAPGETVTMELTAAKEEPSLESPPDRRGGGGCTAGGLFGLLSLALLSAIIAAVIWGPMIIRQRAADIEAEATVRPTLQTYVERGHLDFTDEKSKNAALSLLPYESISLERTACFGDCPVYVVTFYKDGHATLVTDNWQDNGKRYYTGKIWMGQYVRLTQMAELAKNATRQAGYWGQWTDDYTAIIRASSKDQSWTVSDYGRVAPVEVWTLETLLHVFKEETEWSPASGL